MARSLDDPFFNIPDIVTGELQQIRNTVSILEIKCAELEKGIAGLRTENTFLREQLLKATQTLATSPTRHDYNALRELINHLSENTWQPSASFITELKNQVAEKLKPFWERPGETLITDSAHAVNEAPRDINLSTLLMEQLALELSPLYSRISAIEEELESKANKRNVVAMVKQRFEEIAKMIVTLQESLTAVLAEKADTETVNNELATKVSMTGLQVILEPYLRTTVFDEFRRGIAVEEGILERISKLELKGVAQQHALQTAIQSSVSMASDKLQSQISDLEALVRANTASISRACASAEAAMADARAVRLEQPEDMIKTCKQIDRSIKLLDSRLSVVETDLIRKVEKIDFQALQRRIQTQDSVEQALCREKAWPVASSDQVKQLITNSIDLRASDRDEE